MTWKNVTNEQLEELIKQRGFHPPDQERWKWEVYGSPDQWQEAGSPAFDKTGKWSGWYREALLRDASRYKIPGPRVAYEDQPREEAETGYSEREQKVEGGGNLYFETTKEWREAGEPVGTEARQVLIGSKPEGTKYTRPEDVEVPEGKQRQTRTAQAASDFEHQQYLKNTVKVGDGQRISKVDLDNLHKTDPKGYRILLDKGFRAYERYAEDENARIAAENAEAALHNVKAETQNTALGKLKPYTTIITPEGNKPYGMGPPHPGEANVDVLAFIRSEKDKDKATQTLVDAGYDYEEVKKWLKDSENPLYLRAMFEVAVKENRSELLKTTERGKLESDAEMYVRIDGLARAKAYEALTPTEKRVVEKETFVAAEGILVPGVETTAHWAYLSTPEKAIAVTLDVASVAFMLWGGSVVSGAGRKLGLSGIGKIERLAVDARKTGEAYETARAGLQKTLTTADLGVNRVAIAQEANAVQQLEIKAAKASLKFTDKFQTLKSVSPKELTSIEKKSGVKGFKAAVLDVSKAADDVRDAWKYADRSKFYATGTTNLKGQPLVDSIAKQYGLESKSVDRIGLWDRLIKEREVAGKYYEEKGILRLNKMDDGKTILHELAHPKINSGITPAIKKALGKVVRPASGKFLLNNDVKSAFKELSTIEYVKRASGFNSFSYRGSILAKLDNMGDEAGIKNLSAKVDKIAQNYVDSLNVRNGGAIPSYKVLSPIQLEANNRHILRMAEVQAAQTRLAAALEKAGSHLAPRYKEAIPEASKLKGFQVKFKLDTSSAGLAKMNAELTRPTKPTPHQPVGGKGARQVQVVTAQDIGMTEKEFAKFLKERVDNPGLSPEQYKARTRGVLAEVKPIYEKVPTRIEVLPQLKVSELPKVKPVELKSALLPRKSTLATTRTQTYSRESEKGERLWTQKQQEKAYETNEDTNIRNETIADFQVKSITESLTKTAQFQKLSPAEWSQVSEMVKAGVSAKAGAQAKAGAENLTQTQIREQVKDAVKQKAKEMTKVQTQPLTQTQQKAMTKTIVKEVVTLKIPTRPPVKKVPVIPIRLPRGGKPDEEFRAIIKNANGALAWRQGELRGKDIWNVIVNPYQSNEDYLQVIGKSPEGAALFRGKGSARKTARMIYGTPPKKDITVDSGFQDLEFHHEGRNIKLDYKPDPQGLTRGDITIGGRNGAMISERQPRISGRRYKITQPRPRIGR